MKTIKNIRIKSIIVLGLALFLMSPNVTKAETKKVFIHYMAWFGPESHGRHWNDGVPREPMIGYYDSRSWSAQMHHMLLSWSCGIDGLVINVRDSYDDKCLRLLTPALNRILEVDANFDYQFAVSYDDQGMGTIAIAEEKFSYLKNNILPNTNSYVYSENEPVVFIWNYPDFLSAADYRTALGNVFTESTPKVIWNEIDETAQPDVNSFYPWVQGFADDGSNWGEDYLNWFYNTIGGKSSLDFATGGVYPGFDDRSCNWGQSRWIDRQDGGVYDKTWHLAKNYKGALPLDWVVIETWNDWNEGSEIEPSVEHGFQYLQKTITQINAFKDTLLVVDDLNFLASTKLYEASLLIENEEKDSITYYPILKDAIASFLQGNCSESIEYSESIIGKSTGINNPAYLNQAFTVYPNPASDVASVQINLQQSSQVDINLFNSNGQLVQTLNAGVLYQGNNVLNLNLETLEPGLYFYELITETGKASKKLIIK